MSVDNLSHRYRLYKALPLEERLALALNKDIDAIDRDNIVHREQWMQVRVYFARRLDLLPAEIEVFLNDQDHVIRLCIAKRSDLTPGQVAQCVADRDPNVRYFIARNMRLTSSQRELLLHDADPLVQRAATKGPRAPRITGRPGQALLIR